jgi:SAP domain
VADEIKDVLFQQYNVQINDKAKEWLVMPDTYRFIGDPTAVDPATFDYLDQRLQERFAHKNNRNWDEADAIRDELQEKYGVVFDDRSFEWSITKTTGNDDDDTVESRPGAAVVVRSRIPSSPPPPANGGTTVEYKFKEKVAPVSNLGDNDDEDVEDDDVFYEEEGDEDEDEGFDDDAFDDNEVMAKNGETTTTTSLSKEYLSSLTIPELKEKLRNASLPLSGRKAELVERLFNA